MHRLEVLKHSLDAHHETWRNKDGTVVLLRRRGEVHWRAIVDRVLVLDAERLNGPMAYRAKPGAEPDPAMKAADPRALATSLAMQDHVHCVFDQTIL